MTTEGLTVAVLGAGGTIAPPIVRDLAESPEAARLKLLDLDGEKAAATARDHGGNKSVAIEVDGREEGALESQLEDVDVLVNSASYRINVDVMEACLRAGAHYIDLGGLYHVTAEQLKLHERFEAAGLLALLGMGSAPGKTNLMAAVATEQLGGGVDRIDITAGGRDLDPPGGFAPPYAVQTLLDELTLKPIVLRAGEPVEIEPLSDAGVIDFPDPIGDAPAIYTLHSELLTFGSSFGCDACTFRLSLGPAVLDRLIELTTANPEEIVRAAAEAVKPSASTVSFHLIDAYRDDRRVRVACKTSPVERWGLGGSVVSTSAPAAAAVRLLARGLITARGALPPELAVNPDDLFAELETRGAEFSVTEYETA
ncbi:MAG: saccharopine dehydrogenase NADP-binding domain-containing protein [Solirubrobacterales bacterium]